jgi:8-amino-7-oxononanoate synthase
MATSWHQRIARRNDEVRAAGRWRSVRALDGGGPATRVHEDGRSVVSFASNDYLGLSQHPEVIAAAHAALERHGAGAGAARLIVGARPVHDELEAALARWFDRPAALLFPSGYQANLGVLGALAACADGAVLLSDELNHASIIDGCRLARASTAVYRHRDVGHLAELLHEHRDRPTIVVTDSVFSMDGDTAPLAKLAELTRDTGSLLVVDEAHAVLAGPPPPDAVVVGTLSKTLGSVGGFVAGDRSVIDLLVNSARPFIFTTAGAPADAAAALAAVGIVAGEEGAALRSRLRAHVERIAPGHGSPIVPIVLGEESAALAASAALLERGLLVPAIRPPTVAPGTCRLRVALSAAHTDEQVASLRHALDELALDELALDEPGVAP